MAVLTIKHSAMESYQLAKNMHWLSHHDEQTGVFNRRGIFAWQAQNGLFTSRSLEPVSLAILDLDHFKKIND